MANVKSIETVPMQALHQAANTTNGFSTEERLLSVDQHVIPKHKLGVRMSLFHTLWRTSDGGSKGWVVE